MWKRTGSGVCIPEPERPKAAICFGVSPYRGFCSCCSCCCCTSAASSSSCFGANHSYWSARLFDILKNSASPSEYDVVGPKTFHLLAAGTAIRDTDRSGRCTVRILVELLLLPECTAARRLLSWQCIAHMRVSDASAVGKQWTMNLGVSEVGHLGVRRARTFYHRLGDTKR